MTAHADSEEVRPARIRLSPPAVARSIVIAAAVAWLVAGGVGAYLYVHRYWLYRGFPPPVTPAGVATGTPVRVSFFSPALGRRASYLVYLPAGYERALRAGPGRCGASLPAVGPGDCLRAGAITRRRERVLAGPSEGASGALNVTLH